MLSTSTSAAIAFRRAGDSGCARSLLVRVVSARRPGLADTELTLRIIRDKWLRIDVEMKQKRVMYGDDARERCERQTQFALHGPCLPAD